MQSLPLFKLRMLTISIMEIINNEIGKKRKARKIVISKNTKIKNLEEEYLGSWEILAIIPAVIHKDVDSSTVRLRLEQLPPFHISVKGKNL